MSRKERITTPIETGFVSNGKRYGFRGWSSNGAAPRSKMPHVLQCEALGREALSDRFTFHRDREDFAGLGPSQHPGGVITQFAGRHLRHATSAAVT